MEDPSESFHPDPSDTTKVVVTHKRNQGVLVVSDKYLIFSSLDGAMAQRWRWSKLDHPTANKADPSKHPVLRVTHDQDGDLFFRFSNRDDLMNTKEDFLFRIASARAQRDAAISEAIDALTDIKETRDSRRFPPGQGGNDLPSSLHFSTNHTAESTVYPSMELELSILRKEVAELAQWKASMLERDDDIEHTPFGDMDPLISSKSLVTTTSTPLGAKQMSGMSMSRVSPAYQVSTMSIAPSKQASAMSVATPNKQFSALSMGTSSKQASAMSMATSRLVSVGNLVSVPSLIQGPDDDEDVHAPFGETSYTFLYMCDMKSRAFWYGIFIYLLELSTMILTIVDVIDLRAKGNPLQIPPMVPTTVTVAQAVGLFLLVAFTTDLMEAVLKLQVRNRAMDNQYRNYSKKSHTNE